MYEKAAIIIIGSTMNIIRNDQLRLRVCKSLVSKTDMCLDVVAETIVIFSLTILN